MMATVAVLACTLALSTACGDDESSPGSADETKTIEITISGDTISPNGDRIQVAVGQEIELVVKSDAPGEIHVHSSPEQDFEYEAGTTTLPLDPIDKPSVVDIESHTLDKTIVQLEVR
jgi:hypothetical protein